MLADVFVIPDSGGEVKTAIKRERKLIPGFSPHPQSLSKFLFFCLLWAKTVVTFYSSSLQGCLPVFLLYCKRDFEGN
jgi:hypothetical protein